MALADVSVLCPWRPSDNRKAIGGDRPGTAPQLRDLIISEGLERGPRPSDDGLNSPPIDVPVDPAELHRAADAQKPVERRASHVDVCQQNGMARHDRRPDCEAIALAGL